MCGRRPGARDGDRVIRESVVDRAHREIAIREIQDLADDYTELLARTHPHLSATEWRAYLGRQIHAIRDRADASELLALMLEALDADGQQ